MAQPPDTILAVADDRRAIVHFSIANEFGLSSYTVTPRIDNVDQTTLQVTIPTPYAPIVVDNLVNGTEYDFRVRVTNEQGIDSAESSPSNLIRPSEPPPAVPDTLPSSTKRPIYEQWDFWLVATTATIAIIIMFVAIGKSKKSKDWKIAAVVSALYAGALGVPMYFIVRDATRSTGIVEAPRAKVIRVPASCIPVDIAFSQTLYNRLAEQDIEIVVTGTKHSNPSCSTPISYRWSIVPNIDDRAGLSTFNIGFRLTETDTDTLFIPRYTLAPGHLYQISAIGGHDGNRETFVNRSFVTIFVQRRALLATIVGGLTSSIVAGRPLILDGRNCEDPDLDPRLGEPYVADADSTLWQGYTFTWTAVNAVTNVPLILSDGTPFGQRTGSFVSLSRRSTINEIGQSFRFTLEFSTGDGSATAQATTTIAVTDLTSPQVQLLSDDSIVVRKGQVIDLTTIIVPKYDSYQLQYDIQPRPPWIANNMLVTTSTAERVKNGDTLYIELLGDRYITRDGQTGMMKMGFDKQSAILFTVSGITDVYNGRQSFVLTELQDVGGGIFIQSRITITSSSAMIRNDSDSGSGDGLLTTFTTDPLLYNNTGIALFTNFNSNPNYLFLQTPGNVVSGRTNDPYLWTLVYESRPTDSDFTSSVLQLPPQIDVNESFIADLWEPDTTYTVSVTVTGQPPGTQITQSAAASTQFTISSIPKYVGTPTADPDNPHNDEQILRFALNSGGDRFSFSFGTIITPFVIGRSSDAGTDPLVRIGDIVTLHPNNDLNTFIVGGDGQFNEIIQVAQSATANHQWTVVSQTSAVGTVIARDLTTFQLQLQSSPDTYIGSSVGNDRIIYQQSAGVDLRFRHHSRTQLQYDTTYNHLTLAGVGSNAEWKTRAVAGVTPVTFFQNPDHWTTETPPLSFKLFYTLPNAELRIVVADSSIGDTSTRYDGPASVTTTFMPAGESNNTFQRQWGMLIREGSGDAASVTGTIRMFPL